MNIKNLPTGFGFARLQALPRGPTVRGAAAWAAGAAVLLMLGLAVAVAPWAIVLLLALAVVLVGVFGLLAYATAGAPFWIRACTAVVFAQLILNYGFAAAVIPLGSVGAPISELVLTFSIAVCIFKVTLANDPVHLPGLLWLVCVWALLNLALHLPWGLNQHGMAAARDALPTVEVLFVLPGFVAATHLLRLPDGGSAFLKRSLAVLVLGMAVYGLGIGIQEFIIRFSPRMPSLQQTVPLIGSYQSWPLAGLFSMLAFLLWRWQTQEPMTFTEWMAGGLIFISGTYTFFASQSRAAYLIVALFLILLLLLGGQGKRVLVLFTAIICAALFFLLIETLGLELRGRISTLSASQIVDHLFTLSGESEDSEYQGAAGGIAQRKSWIAYSLQLWQQDFRSILVGVGYGDVLTNHTVVGFQQQTILVREPHNSFISILTRSGLLGLMVNATLHLCLLWACVRLYRRRYKTHRSLAALALGVLFIHVYCLLTAMGQPVLESPHFAVPLHFILGAMYAVARHFDDDTLAGRPVDEQLPT